MSEPFPELPKGSPEGIQAAARTLRAAASELESAQSRMGLASTSLSGSWEGQAASAYQSSAQALGDVARGAGETFHMYAQTVSQYASALDHAQSAMRRLRAQYDQATSTAAAASATASQLSGSLAGASKSAKPGIQSQIGTAQTNATNAASDANYYALAAKAVLADFQAQADVYNAELSADPLGPFAQYALGGMLGQRGPDFGIPSTTGLLPYNGVLPLQLPQPSGPGGLLGTIGTIGSVFAVAGGGCEALFFWVPGVDVGCAGAGVLGSEASTLAAWGQVIEGNGKVGPAVLDTVTLGMGGVGMVAGTVGRTLGEGGAVLGKTGVAAGPALEAGGHVVGGGLSGLLSIPGLVPKKDR